MFGKIIKPKINCNEVIHKILDANKEIEEHVSSEHDT